MKRCLREDAVTEGARETPCILGLWSKDKCREAEPRTWCRESQTIMQPF